MTILQDSLTLDGMTTTRPPALPQWAPGSGPSIRPASNRRLAVALTIVGLLAIAALVVGIIALAQTPASPPAQQAAPISAEHTYSAADQAAAKNRVCTAFTQVADSVRIATTAPDGSEPVAASANARAAIVGGALAITRSLSDATPKDVADAANALADGYMNYALALFSGQEGDKGSAGIAATNLRQLCS